MNRTPSTSAAANILDVVPEAYVCLDSECRCTFLNRAAEQLLGKSRADLLGKVLWEVCPEPGRTLFEGGCRDAMAERVPVAFEDYYGPWQRWYATSATPDPEGGIMLRAVDITERKRAEHEMAASREEFDRFFALIPDLAVVASADGFFKKVNPAWEKTLGFSIAELLGQPFESFIHPDDVAATCQEVLRQLDGQSTIRFVNRYRTKAGEYRWLEWEATPAVGGSLYATARDITARKQAEAALRESEAKFRELFDGAPVAYHELDMDGMVRRVNRAECALLGYEAGDMLGRPIWEFISEADREASREVFHRKLSGECPLRPYQRCYLRRDGGDLWVEIHDALVRNEKGETVGIRTALLDITERKRAEEYRKMNEEVLQILNGPGDLQDAIQRVLAALNTLTRCDAIGMRLQDGEDFPYFAQEGFSEGFLLTENTLLERAADGGVCRDNDGAVRLECTCGLVISGRTDPANPLFTKGGSCWTNDSLPLLDIPLAEDPRLNPRNECIHHGYASVALVPIRSPDRIVGLIHLNGRSKGRFTLDTIELLEGIAAHIGEALMRKRAEEKSRAKEHVLSESQRVAHVGSWSWNLATDAMVWTSELYRVFGVSPDTFVPSAEALLSVIHPDDRAAMQAWIVACIAGEEPPELEFRVNLAGGGVRYIYGRGNLVRDAENKPIRLTGIGQDITERKRAEEALLEREARLREAEQLAHVGSSSWDVDSDTTTWSAELYRITGRDPGMPAPRMRERAGIYAPESWERLDKAVERALATGEPYELELEVVRPDGAVRQTLARGRAARDGLGRVVRLYGTLQDVTEQKRAEEESAKLQAQFHQAQKMESIGRLAGGVAHDFNNLLTVINGYSQMLLAKSRAGDPLRDSLEEIHTAGERAAELTGQLLAFSRKQVLEPRPLDINRVVEDMRPMLERLVGEDVEVRVALHAEAGTTYADPHQLGQVVMNLAVNSRDAMPHGGKLLIETACVERDESYARSHLEALPGRFVTLAVSDTGVGIDEETKNRIFEPFFTTKEVGKGTGLGLSTVQGIVAQSGGHVEVYSEKGVGTTFKIYLPALAEAAADTGGPAAVPPLGGKETILVVEDQAKVRKYAVAVLKEYGYRVIPAENAGEALLICEREHIDLLLTDVIMPNLSGPELAERLDKLQPGVTVLFMSGYTDDAIVQHGVLKEGATFIQKPFSPEELAGKVRAVLG